METIKKQFIAEIKSCIKTIREMEKTASNSLVKRYLAESLFSIRQVLYSGKYWERQGVNIWPENFKASETIDTIKRGISAIPKD